MIRLTIEPKGLNFISLAIFAFFSTSFISCLPTTDSGFRKNFSKNTPKICTTPACQEAADSLLAAMDESVNPCDNFYQFTCGNFIKTTVIPEGKGSTDVGFNREAERLNNELKATIEKKLDKNEPKSFQLVKAFYDTCMNTDQIDKNSEKEVLEMLNKLGGWPVLVGKSWKDSQFDWMKTNLKAREIGLLGNYFIDMVINPDEKDTSIYRLHLYSPTLPLELLVEGRNSTDVKSYFKLMVDFAEVLGADPKQAKDELSESLDFEIELARITLINNSNGYDFYNPITIKDLQTKYPSIPFLDYLKGLLPPYLNISSDEIVVVSYPDYFQKLADLLSRTSKRAVANHLFWRIIMETYLDMGNKVLQVYQKYLVMNGYSPMPPRWKYCLGKTKRNFPSALGALYVRRHFDHKSKISASYLISNIRKGFKKMLAEVNWMDKKSRSEAQAKIAHIRQFVGYPDEFLNDEKLDSYHRSLKLDRESLLKSSLNLNLFHFQRAYEKLRKPNNKNDWTEFGSTMDVNAYYNRNKNSITFPAGILNGIFFNRRRPKYMNYGTIGSIIGHEIMHGFDNSGRYYDKDGNKVDWWDSETMNKYTQRAQCMVDQYNNYTVKEVDQKVDGVLTLDENIADNGGIKEAYYAYEIWEKRNGVEPHLPGLEKYTSRQMFWITSAASRCVKMLPWALKSQLRDVHAPDEFRVMGMASNSAEFAKDFNCPVGSPMNPVEKCMIW